MNTIQQGDTLIFIGDDDGNMNVEDGITEMTQGYDSMISIILFGGNEDDNNTSETNHLQWCGNFQELEAQILRGKFQFLLKNIPITSENLKLLRDAAAEDITNGFGNLLKQVFVTIEAINNRHLRVYLDMIMSDGTVINRVLEIQKNGNS